MLSKDKLDKNSKIITPSPRYSYPASVILGLSGNVLFGGRRSFRRDALACMARVSPPLQVSGAENIPPGGPCLVVFNHYYRPGFNAWWLALGIAGCIPAEMHWGMTGELTFAGRWYAPLASAGSRWLLRRIASVYNFTTLPPMPPRPQDVQERARSVRRMLSWARAHPQAFIGLAPEGSDNPPTGNLARPAPGSGRFIGLLAEQGFPLLPVGAWEEEGGFRLDFGPLFRPEVPQGVPAAARDRSIADEVMGAIATRLPERLRGEFQ